jgi:hypothetical protein
MGGEGLSRWIIARGLVPCRGRFTIPRFLSLIPSKDVEEATVKKTLRAILIALGRYVSAASSQR